MPAVRPRLPGQTVGHAKLLHRPVPKTRRARRAGPLRSTRPRFAPPPLPLGIRTLSDYEWEPAPPRKKKPTTPAKPKYTKEQKLAYQTKRRRLAILRKFEREEWDYIRRYAKAIEAVAAADREFVRLENEREERRLESEAELKRIQDYFNGERDKELRAHLARITKELNKDIVKNEREVLARRGVIRGIRS